MAHGSLTFNFSIRYLGFSPPIKSPAWELLLLLHLIEIHVSKLFHFYHITIIIYILRAQLNNGREQGTENYGHSLLPVLTLTPIYSLPL